MASHLQSHPRRRPQKLAAPPLSPPASPTPATLFKSDTFSARSPASTLYHPIENARFVPKRSPTSLADLVLDDVDDSIIRQQKLAKFLGEIDDVVAGRASPDRLQEEQVWATVVDNTAPLLEPMLIDEKKDAPSHNHHESDSGLGSSVDSPIGRTMTHSSLLSTDMNTKEPRSSVSGLSSNAASSATTFSAINQSHSFENAHRPSGRRLSRTAYEHIDQNFLQPILKDSSLSAFHPLIQAIPKQVGDNFISNLRDLEKTLLYQAPVSLTTYLSACAVAYYHGRDVKNYCLSSKSFRDFWTFSISCLHTTVQFLNERDQRRPSDRPYTSTYFVDLVEQIRRYADIMARTRQKQADGEDLDDMDYSPYVDSASGITLGSHDYREETVAVRGTPASLVRMKNGKSISLAPENARFETMSSKRPHSEDEFESDDDDVMRSMARRRKSDKAADVVHSCRACNKEFKRPCDLTKHEKTHSRPFKCSDSSCRYHDLGWPTEKERDRHENDKHSANPKLFRCNYKPCTYSSKRESNCKQHMEKAHGWQYVRSKSNGKNKMDGTDASPSSFASAANTPGSSRPTYGSPESFLTPSPVMGNSLSPPDLFSSTHHTGRRDSATTEGSAYSNNTSPYSGFSHMVQPIVPTKGFATAISPYVAEGDFTFQPNSFQQPTPALSSVGLDFDFDTGKWMTTGTDTTLSEPLAAFPATANTGLLFDETFGEGQQPMGDFQLFDDPVATPGANNFDSTNWFQDLNSGDYDQFTGLEFNDSTSGFYQQ
jgi:hypothetical protein